MDPSAEGKVYPDVAFVVDPVRVAAFRAIFGVQTGMPPTFATSAEFTVLPQVLADPSVDVDFRRVVHGSQEYVFERPLHEGETLSVRARIASVKQKGSTGFMTVETQLFDADGALVCTARSQLVERAP
jgi:acyl dehydratase